MQTQSAIPSPQQSAPPLVVLKRLLLTETGSAASLTASSNLAPEMLTVRATHVTRVLSEILEQRGYPHGGIND